jgi:hypothetical protein
MFNDLHAPNWFDLVFGLVYSAWIQGTFCSLPVGCVYGNGIDVQPETQLI